MEFEELDKMHCPLGKNTAHAFMGKRWKKPALTPKQVKV